VVATVVSTLIQTHKGLFDKPLKEACLKKVTPEEIITVNAYTKPKQSPLRRFSPADIKVLEEQIPTLERNGVIEKSSSPWRHTPVLVPKRDGGTRIAINYKPINEVTEFDAYPIPRIDDLLSQLAGAQMFSLLDFSQFYHQIPLIDSDKPKTAFYALGELWQFKRCPFGLKNAVTRCMRVMKQVFQNLDGVLIYLDDVLVYGKSQEEHDKRLERVLKRIEEHGLSLNSSKCKFGLEKVSYLGHLIDKETIQPDPERTRPITECPRPQNLKQLERFLGMANYFRNYINNYAMITLPLYQMKRTEDMNWTEDRIQSFNNVKNKIKDAVLIIPESSEELTLRTDASNTCIAAYLEDSFGRPVAFASRILSTTEQRYDIVEKEALAIFWSIVMKFRWFLLGRKFSVITDHKPLVYLLSTTKVSPKILRWRLQLQEFNFSIEHCSGSRNIVADTLSRVCYAEEDMDEEDIATQNDSIFISEDVLKRKQMEDIECCALWRAICANEKRPATVSHSLWSIRNCIRKKDGVLYYEDEGRERWLIPHTLRLKMLQLAHDNHKGVEGTLARLRRHAYWPNSREDVTQFIKECRICSLVKPEFKPATLTPFSTKAPMEILATDYVGPLPVTAGGFRYMLVFIDMFSRYAEVFPCRDMSVATLIEKSKEVFSRYGFPDALLSDQGTQFESREYRAYLAKFGIKKLRTSTYHPQGNGLCERFNQTLQRQMLSLQLENNRPKTEWARLLPTVLLSYRNTPHTSTGYTPSELFFGFAVKTFANRGRVGEERYKKASHRMDTNAQRRKNIFDKRAQDREFQKGDQVLIKSPQVGKLEMKGRIGTVAQQINKSLVEVSQDGEVKCISTSRLSPVASGRESGTQEIQQHHKGVRFEIQPVNWKDRLRPRPEDFQQRYVETRRRGM
jgi:transposase InsO family protein